jgi:signal transduction histidine kinase
MKRWFADTLFMRLFVLMWVALVASHVIAYAAGAVFRAPPPGHDARSFTTPLPTFPSLPPTPGLGGQGPHAKPGLQPGADTGPGGPQPPSPFHQGPEGPGAPDDLPWSLAVLDYGVRLLIIGLAAWLGARWLSAPMRKLSKASRSLGSALGRDERVPAVDEAEGTVEVRETARVFNEMARQLHTQFQSRGLLVAALSHDLRTPLTRMRMRLARLPEDPLVERCALDIRDMNELIDSALALFRDTASVGPLQSTDVCSVVQSLTDDLIEQGLPVSFCGDMAVADCQPVLLRRVVSNLVSNAVRYGQRAEVSVGVHGGEVHIVVNDQGPGIPAQHLEVVFEPFYRVEGSRSRDTGGAGLGLYIARDLITRQGGTLALTNRAEGGLQAVVRLPVRHVSSLTQSG